MTIRHVVSWRLAAADPAAKAGHAAAIRSGLEGLPALVHDIRSLEVGVNSVPSDGNWDLVLIADFDDADALARYTAHPEHQKVAAFIRSVTDKRSAVDFEV